MPLAPTPLLTRLRHSLHVGRQRGGPRAVLGAGSVGGGPPALCQAGPHPDLPLGGAAARGPSARASPRGASRSLGRSGTCHGQGWCVTPCATGRAGTCRVPRCHGQGWDVSYCATVWDVPCCATCRAGSVPHSGIVRAGVCSMVPRAAPGDRAWVVLELYRGHMGPYHDQHRNHTAGSLGLHPEPCHRQSPLPCPACPGCARPRCQHRTVPPAAGQDTPGQPVPAPQVLLGPPHVGQGEIKERPPPLPAGMAGSERVPWAPAWGCQSLQARARRASPWGHAGCCPREPAGRHCHLRHPWAHPPGQSGGFSAALH